MNNLKIKLKGAQTGHSLLKRKSDALSSRFRGILARIRAAKYEMNELLKTSTLAMAQVNYAAGDISYAVREASTTGPAQFQVRTRVENVSGVQLPIFEGHIVSTTPSTTISSPARQSWPRLGRSPGTWRTFRSRTGGAATYQEPETPKQKGFLLAFLPHSA